MFGTTVQLEDTNANQLCHWAYVGITFGIISQLLEPALKLRHLIFKIGVGCHTGAGH